MNRKDLEILADLIADRVTARVLEKMVPPPKERIPDMVDSTEAARILGVSRRYLLQIKERFNYVKVGESKQSRVFFPKEEIYKEFNFNKK